jgi:hypothetical protein
MPRSRHQVIRPARAGATLAAAFLCRVRQFMPLANVVTGDQRARSGPGPDEASEMTVSVGAK